MLATAMASAINGLDEFTAGAVGNLVTVTTVNTGDTIDIINQFTSPTTCSTAVSQQGGLVGYDANEGNDLVIVTQSADLVFNGLGKTEGYSWASTPFIKSQKINSFLIIYI